MPKRKKKGVLVISQTPSTSSDQKEFYDDYEEMASGSTWVQCENTKCLKWRRITAEAAQYLGDKPWYCWLNPDSRYNKCSVEEEKLKKPKDMKFVYSLLPVGQVVMARMTGYPLWPAILTVDQYYGEYYDSLTNKENEVTHYHVEFLGDPHSHAWVAPSGVHPFTSVSEKDKVPKFRKLQGKRVMDLKKSFQLALSEAEALLKMDKSQRLSRCHFHLKEFTPIFEDSEACDTEPAQKRHCVEQRKRVHSSTSSSTISSTDDDPCERDLHLTPHFIHRRRSSTESEDSQREASDPEERNFMESLKTFLASKGLSVHKEPRWRGRRISLFKFYNTVLRNGGCEQVCKGRLWTSVYNELVGADTSHNHNGIGTTARHFYERYLLPFEIYRKRPSSLDVQFVSDDNAVTGKTATSDTVEPSNNEQTVPEQAPCSLSRTNYKPDWPNELREHVVSSTTDYVPSSNPESPLPYSDCTTDSEVEDDCEAAENELIQLERLLSSLEPSLKSPEEPNEISTEKQSGNKVTSAFSNGCPPNNALPQIVYFPNCYGGREELDVLKTLEEMAKMEGAILELDSLVALELDELKDPAFL